MAGNICRYMQSSMLKRSHRDSHCSQSSGGGGQSMNLLGDSKAVSMLCRQVWIWGPKEAAGQSHGVVWTHVILVSKGHSVVHSSQAITSCPIPPPIHFCIVCVVAALGPERLPLPKRLDLTGLAVTWEQWHHPVEWGGGGQCYEIRFN